MALLSDTLVRNSLNAVGISGSHAIIRRLSIRNPLEAPLSNGVVVTADGTLELEDFDAEDASNQAVGVLRSRVRIESSTVRRSSLGFFVSEGSTLTLSRASFDSCADGLHIGSSTATITDSWIRSSAGAGVQAVASKLSIARGVFERSSISTYNSMIAIEDVTMLDAISGVLLVESKLAVDRLWISGGNFFVNNDPRLRGTLSMNDITVENTGDSLAISFAHADAMLERVRINNASEAGLLLLTSNATVRDLTVTNVRVIQGRASGVQTTGDSALALSAFVVEDIDNIGLEIDRQTAMLDNERFEARNGRIAKAMIGVSLIQTRLDPRSLLRSVEVEDVVEALQVSE